MPITRSKSAFSLINYTFLIALALLCILPFINILAISLSSGAATLAGRVKLWPVEFSWDSYAYVVGNAAFWKALLISMKRLLIGVPFSMLVIILTSYPLAKDREAFRLRTPLVWYFVFTMLFGGGLIPSYLLVMKLGLLDSIWALVLPGAVPVFSVVLLLNFMRAIPREISDSVAIDGAGEWQTLWRIIVPLSTPALATLLLFNVVSHWNSWFDGMVYNNISDHYPLQTYLSSLVSNLGVSVANVSENADKVRNFNGKTVLAAQILVAALPMIAVYPFVQKYFTKGIVMGSVKE